MKTPAITADMNEILFEGKNKAYGAYAIRQGYGKTILNSFYIASIGVLALVMYFFWSFQPPSPKISATEHILPPDSVLKQLPPDKPEEKILEDEKKQEEEKPQGDEKKPAEPIQQTASVVPVADSAAADTSTINAASEMNGNLGTENREGCKDCKPQGDSTGCIDCKPAKVDSLKDKVWSEGEIDESADIPNIDEVKQCISYPPAMREMGMEGAVFLTVVIDENGDIMSIDVRKTTHPLFTAAVQKCAPKMKGKAGKAAGRNVKSRVTVPFHFKLGK